MNMTIRKIILYTLVLIVPLLFVGNVRQSFRFVQLERDMERIHAEHIRVLEENKRLVVGISSLRSPSRIRAIAESDLDLDAVPAGRVRRIELNGGLRGQ